MLYFSHIKTRKHIELVVSMMSMHSTAATKLKSSSIVATLLHWSNLSRSSSGPHIPSIIGRYPIAQKFESSIIVWIAHWITEETMPALT